MRCRAPDVTGALPSKRRVAGGRRHNVEVAIGELEDVVVADGDDVLARSLETLDEGRERLCLFLLLGTNEDPG